MKKIIYLSFLFQSLLFYGQTETIQVGNAPNVFDSRGNLPFQVVYGYNYSQTIYHASEINQSGYITRLEWHTAASSAVTYSAENSVIYIGTTTKTSFDSTTDWIPISQLTEVYQGGTFWGENTWGGIDLTTPFYYNGVDNLVIAFDDNDSSWQPSNSFLVDDRPENRGILKRHDNQNTDPNSPGTANFIYSYIPNTIFRFQKNHNCQNASTLSPTLAFADFPIVGQSNIGADNSGATPNATCGDYQGGDLWYKVTVPSNGILNIETKGSSGDTAMQVYSGNCGALTLLACDDNSGDNDFSLVNINDISLANQTLYIRVWEPGNNENVLFDIAAWSTSLPILPATSLNFDGTNDSVTGPNLDLANKSFSIEFWAKRESFDTAADAVISQGTGGLNGALYVGLSSVDSFIFDFGANLVESNSTITDTNWHHYAVTYNAATKLQSIYIDGTLDATRTSTSDFIGSGNIIIGNYSNYGYFDGNIDDLRVWNYELSATDITNRSTCELNGNESGLLVYYRFNQGNGNVNNSVETGLYDDVTGTINGAFNNFTLIGASSNFVTSSQLTSGSNVSQEPVTTNQIIYEVGDTASQLTASGSNLLWYTSENGGVGSSIPPTPDTSVEATLNFYVSSTSEVCESRRVPITVFVGTFNFGTSLDFDGINDAINCGNNASLQITGNAITVEAMIKVNSFKPNAFEGNIVNKEQTNQANGFMLRTGGSGILEFYCGNGDWNGVVSPSNILQIGVWHHVAATYDGNIMRLYVDGTQVASVNTTISISNSNANLFLGDWANGGRNLDAEMDEVRLWNIARTAQQIIDNKDCELFGNESGLVAYYQFNQGITGADNSTENNVLDSGPNSNNGILQNFTLNGLTSNWSGNSVIVSGSSCSTLGIDDMAEGGAFSIYPNPTQGILNIKGFDTIESVSIYDINGRLTKKFNEVSNIIDISNLPIGFYFVSVINQSGTKTFKIMKE